MAGDGMAIRTAARTSTVSDELIRRVDLHTSRQVQNLQIDCDGGRIVVTGQSRTYYIKQLVTQAIVASFPAMQIRNEIAVS
jgi:hypothetical protein